MGSETKSLFAKSKRPYTKPEVKKIKPADAKRLLEEKANPDDAGTKEMLKQLGLREGITNARIAEIQRELEKRGV